MVSLVQVDCIVSSTQTYCLVPIAICPVCEWNVVYTLSDVCKFCRLRLVGWCRTKSSNATAVCLFCLFYTNEEEAEQEVRCSSSEIML